MVLLSQLQYRMQLLPLSANKCHILDVIIRKAFKSVNKFSCTAPNVLFTSFNFYGLKDLWHTQVADIITFLLNQFNYHDPLFSQLSRIHLFHLQKQELNPTSPLYLWTPLYDSFQSYQSNFLAF